MMSEGLICEGTDGFIPWCLPHHWPCESSSHTSQWSCWRLAAPDKCLLGSWSPVFLRWCQCPADTHKNKFHEAFWQTQTKNKCVLRQSPALGAVTIYLPPGGSRGLKWRLNFSWTLLNISMTTATTISMSSLVTCSGQRPSTVLVCWTLALIHMAYTQSTSHCMLLLSSLFWWPFVFTLQFISRYFTALTKLSQLNQMNFNAQPQKNEAAHYFNTGFFQKDQWPIFFWQHQLDKTHRNKQHKSDEMQDLTHIQLWRINSPGSSR